MKQEEAIAFLEEAARYFASRPAGDEDRAMWANVYNVANCYKIIDLIKAGHEPMGATFITHDAHDAIALPVSAALLDLLAVIHRDGGHKTKEIGWRLAWEQAMEIVADLITTKKQKKDVVAQIVAWIRANKFGTVDPWQSCADAIESGIWERDR